MKRRHSLTTFDALQRSSCCMRNSASTTAPACKPTPIFRTTGAPQISQNVGSNVGFLIFSTLQRHVGGESGIRTHGRVSPTHAFQACSIDHSDISPFRINNLQSRTGRDQGDCDKSSNVAAITYGLFQYSCRGNRRVEIVASSARLLRLIANHRASTLASFNMAKLPSASFQRVSTA
jgi:hypothetical protein